jgi:formamidopyrimidine-DNA glycosylase
MPELPDLIVYREAIEKRCVGELLEQVRIKSPFLLRTVDPPIAQSHGKRLNRISRFGKRLVFELDGGIFILIHLMIAGRFQWKAKGAGIPGKIGLAALDFSTGSLLLTEASTKKRASMHVVRGAESLDEYNRGGIEVLEADLASFTQAVKRENHTLKRILTDPRLFSGIGNSYSDEILHRAGLSPLKRSFQLDSEEIHRLYMACRDVLVQWTDRLRSETGDGFPTRVTAFREGMAVHGRYGLPCPACGGAVQRIVYSENECNYCPRCQTGGKILADRALSRILKGDWPRNLDELEELISRHNRNPGESDET